MFTIEKKYKVKATYYFRWVTFDEEFIDQLINSDFEVGLHYETLSAYCTQNNIQSVDKEVISLCQERLKHEIKIFSGKVGVKVKTVSSHGTSKNKELGISNNVLLESANYEDFDISCAAYDRKLYCKVKAHIMDADILENFGFSYPERPLSCIEEGKSVIVFLSHPVYWYYNPLRRAKRLIKFLMGRYTTSTARKFKRIDISGLRDTKQEFASESVINLGN
jgi:hypothetical protein